MKRRFRDHIAAMQRGHQRRYHVNQAQNTVQQILAELVGMQQNIQTLKLIEHFLTSGTILSSEARNMAQCLAWIDGMKQGSTSRCAELEGQLPKEKGAVSLAVAPDEVKADEPIGVGVAQ